MILYFFIFSIKRCAHNYAVGGAHIYKLTRDCFAAALADVLKSADLECCCPVK